MDLTVLLETLASEVTSISEYDYHTIEKKKLTVQSLILKHYGKDHLFTKEVESISFSLPFAYEGMDEDLNLSAWKDGKQRFIHFIEVVLEDVKNEDEKKRQDLNTKQKKNFISKIVFPFENLSMGLNIAITVPLITTLIAGILAIFGPIITDWVRDLLSGPTKYSLSEEEKLMKDSIQRFEKAKNILFEEYRLDTNKIFNLQIEWFDFANRGKKNEFISWLTVKENDTTFRHITDVFTVRDEIAENLYHGLEPEFDEHIIYPVKFKGVNFLLSEYKGGSGGYLTFQLFSYDGIGKPILQHEEEMLFEGAVFPSDNRIFFSGDNKRYELLWDGKKFIRALYNTRLKYTLGSSNHVLAGEIVNKKLKLSFDGKDLQFKSDSPDRYIALEPIEISVNENIQWDDNFKNNDGANVRFLINYGGFQIEEGFYTTLKPISSGTDTIMVSDNYSKWYDIVVKTY